MTKNGKDTLFGFAVAMILVAGLIISFTLGAGLVGSERKVKANDTDTLAKAYADYYTMLKAEKRDEYKQAYEDQKEINALLLSELEEVNAKLEAEYLRQIKDQAQLSGTSTGTNVPELSAPQDGSEVGCWTNSQGKAIPFSKSQLESYGITSDRLFVNDQGLWCYLVQSGDTLTHISGAFGYSVDQFGKVNGLYDVNVIYAESALIIPYGA